MTDPDYRALCAGLTAALHDWQCKTDDDCYADLINLARAALARWGTPNLAQVRSLLGDGPSDIELLQLMPEPMRDEFSYAAKVCSDVTGGQVKPGIFRVTLNTAALEYARAVLARWGTPNSEQIRSSLGALPVAPAKGLVELVGEAMERHYVIGDIEGSWDAQSRAAIREVAAAAKERINPFDPSLKWGDVVQWLKQEANR
jgi:hypothetical protein